MEGRAPPNPPLVCNARARLNKSGCARNFVFPYLSNLRHLSILLQENTSSDLPGSATPNPLLFCSGSMPLGSLILPEATDPVFAGFFRSPHALWDSSCLDVLSPAIHGYSSVAQTFGTRPCSLKNRALGRDIIKTSAFYVDFRSKKRRLRL